MGSSLDLEVHICDLQKLIADAKAILGQKHIAYRHAKREEAATKERMDLHLKNYRHMRGKADLVDMKDFEITREFLKDARDGYEEVRFNVSRLLASVEYLESYIAKMETKLEPAREERQSYGILLTFPEIQHE